jgi:hypothetical protein
MNHKVLCLLTICFAISVNAATQNQVSKIDLDIEALTKRKDLTPKFQCMVNAMMSHRAMRKLVLTGNGIDGSSEGRRLARLTPASYREVKKLHGGQQVIEGDSWTKSGNGWSSSGSWKSSHSHQRVAGGHRRSWSSSSSSSHQWSCDGSKHSCSRAHHKQAFRSKVQQAKYNRYIVSQHKRIVKRHNRYISKRLETCGQKEKAAVKLQLHYKLSAKRAKKMALIKKRYIKTHKIVVSKRPTRIQKVVIHRKVNRVVVVNRQKAKKAALKSKFLIKRTKIVSKSWSKPRVVEVAKKVQIKTTNGTRTGIKIVKRKLSVKTIHGKKWRCVSKMRTVGGQKKWKIVKRYRYTYKAGHRYKIVRRITKTGKWRTYRVKYTTTVVKGKTRRIRLIQVRRTINKKTKYVTVRKSYRIIRRRKIYRIVKKRIGYTKYYKVIKRKRVIRHTGKWSLKSWGVTVGNFRAIHEYENVNRTHTQYIHKYQYAKYRAFVKWTSNHKEWSTGKKLAYIKFYNTYAMRGWSTERMVRVYKIVRKQTMTKTNWTQKRKITHIRWFKSWMEKHTEWNDFCVKYVIQHHPEWKTLNEETITKGYDIKEGDRTVVKRYVDSWKTENAKWETKWESTHTCPEGYTNYKNQTCVQNCPAGWTKEDNKCVKSHTVSVLTCPRGFTLNGKRCIR